MLKAIDLLKALLIALALMVVNVAISFGVVAVYAILIEPGRDNAFYEAAAQQIAPWSSVVAGIFLFYFAVYRLTIRAPDRSAIGFAVAIWFFYAVIDLAIIVGENALGSLIVVFAVSLASKLLAAIHGARRGQMKL